MEVVPVTVSLPSLLTMSSNYCRSDRQTYLMVIIVIEVVLMSTDTDADADADDNAVTIIDSTFLGGVSTDAEDVVNVQ